jgi:hypothetical protein
MFNSREVMSDVKKCVIREISKAIGRIDCANGCDLLIILPCGSELRIELKIKIKKKRLALVRSG